MENGVGRDSLIKIPNENSSSLRCKKQSEDIEYRSIILFIVFFLFWFDFNVRVCVRAFYWCRSCVCRSRRLKVPSLWKETKKKKDTKQQKRIKRRKKTNVITITTPFFFIYLRKIWRMNKKESRVALIPRPYFSPVSLDCKSWTSCYLHHGRPFVQFIPEIIKLKNSFFLLSLISILPMTRTSCGKPKWIYTKWLNIQGKTKILRLGLYDDDMMGRRSCSSRLFPSSFGVSGVYFF